LDSAAFLDLSIAVFGFSADTAVLWRSYCNLFYSSSGAFFPLPAAFSLMLSVTYFDPRTTSVRIFLFLGKTTKNSRAALSAGLPFKGELGIRVATVFFLCSDGQKIWCPVGRGRKKGRSHPEEFFQPSVFPLPLLAGLLLMRCCER